MSTQLAQLNDRMNALIRAFHAYKRHQHNFTTDGNPIAGYPPTSRLIATSEGIQGGGDFSADRDHKLDIPGLTEDTSPDGAADYTVIYDASGAVHKKVLLSNLPGGSSLPVVDTTAIVKGSADATKQVRIEADGLTTGTTRVITMADQDVSLVPGTDFADASGDPGVDTTAIHDNTAGEIAAVTAKATPATADLLLIEDSAAANAKKRLQAGNLSALFMALTGGTMTGDLTMSGGNIMMAGTETVDGVDLSKNVSAYIGAWKHTVVFQGARVNPSGSSSATVTMTQPYTTVATYIASASIDSSGATYVTGITHDSTTQITIYLSAAHTGWVYWFAFGY